jgi:hypothetical protein
MPVMECVTGISLVYSHETLVQNGGKRPVTMAIFVDLLPKSDRIKQSVVDDSDSLRCFANNKIGGKNP